MGKGHAHQAASGGFGQCPGASADEDQRERPDQLRQSRLGIHGCHPLPKSIDHPRRTEAGNVEYINNHYWFKHRAEKGVLLRDPTADPP